MGSFRFWFVAAIGSAFACVLVAHTVMVLFGIGPSSQVWGRVSYNGRPLAGGTIGFAPVQENQGEFIAGLIDENGYYAMNPSWRSAHDGRVRYKISITPLLHAARDRPAAQAEQSTPGHESASPAATTSPPNPTVGHRLPERFADTLTSGLEVTLGPGPARIDLELTD